MVVLRGCIPKQEEDLKDGECQKGVNWKIGEEIATGVICYCKTDGCNGAGFKQINLIFISAMLAITTLMWSIHVLKYIIKPTTFRHCLSRLSVIFVQIFVGFFSHDFGRNVDILLLLFFVRLIPL